jgi:tetratricopeptide (TPR) repeat protein
LANALGRTPDTHNEALVHYKKAIDLAPDYGSPYFNAALIYLQGQNWDEAEHYLKQADTLMPNNSIVKERLETLAKIRAAIAREAAQPAPEK